MTEVPNSIDPDPPLPPPVAETVRARGRQKKYVLLSVMTLFIAVLAVAAALLLRSRSDDEPLSPKLAVKPAGAVKADDTPEEPSEVSGVDPSTQQKVKQHLARAKRHIRAGRWRSALFFLDQVLIHDPTHAEAKALMAKVEKRAKGKPGVQPVRLSSRRRARVASAPKPSKPKASRSRPRVARARVEAKPEIVIQEAEVAIVSKPSATVHLDGVLLGKTPLRGVTVQPGRHTLRVFEEGYIAYTKEVELKPSQKKTIEVKLKALPTPVQLVRTSKPKPAAPPQKPVAKPPAAVAKPSAPKPAPRAGGRVPTINLPALMKVQVYKDGKKHKMLRQVCNMVESVVSKATGKSAAGTTHSLRDFLYASYRGKVTPLTLYPRTMGYLVAEQLMKGKGRGEISSLLLFNHRNGRIKTLAAKNWRPR
jgi:hypothetical protein